MPATAVDYADLSPEDFVKQLVCEMNEGIRRENNFMRSMREAVVKYGSLTERQLAAVVKFQANEVQFAARKAEEDANAEDVIEGTITVTGEVISAKYKYTQFGETLKITVRDDRGFKVYGTCAKQLQAKMGMEADEFYTDEQMKDLFVGRRIEFTATVNQAEGDTKFGFFSRPRDAKVID